jgi:hypothetical protein
MGGCRGGYGWKLGRIWVDVGKEMGGSWGGYAKKLRRAKIFRGKSIHGYQKRCTFAAPNEGTGLVPASNAHRYRHPYSLIRVSIYTDTGIHIH